MKKHKLTKRLLTSVLSLTMVFTSVNLPPLTTTVHAATVTSATELTSLHAGATLSSGMYYVSGNLTLNADKSKYNGLKIAENSTVYITVPAGVTLTVYGGNGTSATSGTNAKAGTVGGAQITESNSKMTYFKCREGSVPTAGTAGTSSTGGGAAIYVPSSATLILLGEGTINAIGGTGGTAANGTSGSISQWNFSTVKVENGGITQYYYLNSNTNVANTIPSPSTANTGKTGAWNGSGYAGAGGAGGAGASGGGAGIGSNGANGNAGIAGGINAGTWNDGESYAVVSGPTNNVTSVISCGTIKTDGKITISATGGNGGSEGNIGSGADLNKKSASFTYYEKSGANATAYNTKTGTMNWYNGQPGAGGGAGGKGASIGTGGQGGAGGQGGSSGSVESSSYGSPDVPSAATKGANGSNGTAKTPEIEQSTITFTGAASNATQTYNWNQNAKITAPDYTNLAANEVFTGWKVTTPATAFPTEFGYTTSGLATLDTIYQSGEEISVEGIYGNVTLTPQKIAHNHSWQYKVLDNDSSKILAYCNGSENSNYCPYYGEENATAENLTLTLSASNTVYTGSAYNKASVDNKITAVTKANAGSINYVGIDGTTYDSSTTAPTNVGKYQASVTIGGKTATKDFEITKKQVTKPAENTNSFTYNKLQQKYVLTENTDYQITNDTRTNAGTQTVTVALKDKTNTCWADNTDTDLTFTFTIKPADQTGITVGTTNYEFGETVSTPSKTAGTIEENATVTYYYNTENSNQGGTEWSNLANDTLDPGTYYVYAVYAATNNYNAFTTPTSSFEVTGKTIQSSEVTCNHVTETYDGTGYGINVTTTIPNPTIKYGETVNTCTLDESPLKVNASDSAYTIYYEVSARGYYTYKGSQTVKINRADVTVTPNAGQYMVYGDTESALKYVAPDLIGDDTLSGTLGRVAGETKGTYAYTLGTLANSNYNISLDANAPTFEITPRPVTLTWTKSDLTYNGYNQSVTAEVSNKVGSDGFNLTYKNEGTNVNEASEVDNYTAEVTELGNPNYTLEGATGVTQDWSIKYLEAVADVTGEHNNDEWFIGTVTVGKDDYTISKNKENWSTELTESNDGEHTVIYYLRNSAGEITDVKTASFKIDTTDPIATVKVEENVINQVLNNITFGHFFKKTVTVNIDAIDTGSGVAKVEYKKVSSVSEYNTTDWITGNVNGTSFNVTPDEKFIVYVRVTDNAGRVAEYHSDGVVVYTDATASADATYTRTNTADVVTDIEVKNNEIAEISYVKDDGSAGVSQALSTVMMNKNTDYTVENGKIVLKNDFLKNILAGKYILTVKYNAMGEAFVEGTSTGVAPTDSTINLTVKKADGLVSNISDISKVFDRSQVTEPTFGKLGDGAATIAYKVKDADDSTYSEDRPVKAGSYTVRVTVASDDNYAEASATKDFAISKADASITIAKSSYTKTYGDATFSIEGVEKVGESTVTYTSNDTSIVTVDSTGKVTIKGAGETTITLAMAQSTNYEATTKTVTVKVDPKAITVTADNKTKTYVDADVALTYSVNENGLVGTDKLSDITLTRAEGENVGTYDITATQKKGANSNYAITFVKGTFTITKREVSLTNKNIEIVGEGGFVYGGRPQTPEIIVRDDKGNVIPASEYTVSYANNTDASVDTTDVTKKPVVIITDKENGNYTVNGSKTFEIKKAGSSILAPSTTVTKTYGDADFTLDVSGVGGNRPTFTSSNEKVATVDKDGKVSIKGAGTVKITVEIPSSSNYSGTSKEITLNIAPKNIKDAVVTLGEELKSNDTVQTQEVKSVVLDGKEVTYTVTGNTAKDPGNYVMTIKGTGNYTGTVEVPFTVVQGIVHVESVKLNKTTLTLERAGDSESLKVNIAPSNTTNKKVTWKSSNTKVVKIDANGKVTAVGAGTVTITVTTADGAKKVTCKVTVQSNASDLKVAKFGRLKARAKDEKKTSMTIAWINVPEADGYLIYGNLCDTKTQTYAYQFVKDVPAGTTSMTRTKLASGTYYKHYVVAYKKVGGKKKRIAVSVPIHATTAGGDSSVAQAVKVTKISKRTSVTKVTLAKGASVEASAVEVKGAKPIAFHRALRYECGNTKVATVSNDGKITAVAKGKAWVWVYAQNGVYKSIEVTVK